MIRTKDLVRFMEEEMDRIHCFNISEREYIEEIVARLKNQPTITEEWIIESAENVAADYPEVAFPNLIAIFEGLLTEAGVSITVDPHRKSGK